MALGHTHFDSARKYARKLFEIYNSQGPNPWKTWDGKDVPKWDSLGEQVQAKWLACGLAVSELLDE